MNAIQAPFPALGADCITVLDAGRCQGLKDAGLKYVVRYLGSLTAGELSVILASGLLCSIVTYADSFDGPTTIRALGALWIPKGVTVYLDLESTSQSVSAVTASVNNWASHVSASGWQPGLYVGADQPLSGAQLYTLGVVRYWESMSAVPDPQCGYCMRQLYKTVTIAGTEVDINVVQYDYEDRLPTFVGA